MILDEMNIAYLEIKERFRNGQLEMDELVLAIDKLRLISADGTQWRINQNGQGWVYWDETYWKRGNPGEDSTLKPLFDDWKNLLKIDERPESTSEFIMTFLKRMTFNFIKQIPKKVLVAILVVFVFNALTNYMYYRTASVFWDRLAQMLQTRRSLLTRFVYYYTLALIIGSFIRNRKTLIKTLPIDISNIASEGKGVLSRLQSSGLSMSIGILISLYLGSLLEGRLVDLLLMIVFMMAVSRKSSSNFIMFLQLVQSDLEKFRKSKKREGFEISAALGLIVGLLLALILGDSYTSYGLYVAIALVIVFIIKQALTKEVQ